MGELDGNVRAILLSVHPAFLTRFIHKSISPTRYGRSVFRN
jgi:hypothetical protein